ncbi:MAG TPA: DUF2127 domain-containing protein, partial [Polyangia bacterium]
LRLIMAHTEIVDGVSPRARGVRAIVLYKFAKCIGEALLAATIVVLMLTGSIARAHELAAALKEHLVHHWSIKLAEMAMHSLTGKRLLWLVAALIGDAVVSGVEGFALGRGYSWGAWLVVAATSLLLPVEIIEMSYRTTAGRVILFAVNLTIVLYLLRQAMKEHHAAHPHR